jgi:hypothetical protein
MKMKRSLLQCLLKYWLRKRLERVRAARRKIKRSRKRRRSKRVKRVRMSFD